MRVTCLIENTGPDHLVREHGLALHVSYGGRSYLLDAGSSGAFAANAEALGLDLAGVERAALSHGHYDHSDGFSAFFAKNDSALVALRPDALDPAKVARHFGRFIAMDRKMTAKWSHRFEPVVGDKVPFAEGLWLVPDEVSHEQSLVAETKEGLVVMNSCCHAGADRIVSGVLDRFPGHTVRAIIGGFHLMGRLGVKTMGPSAGEVEGLTRRLTDELGVKEIYTGHCTGTPALAVMTACRPEAVLPLTTGLVMEFACA